MFFSEENNLWNLLQKRNGHVLFLVMLGAIFGALVFPSDSLAVERILSFHSDIDVGRDAVVTVSETIEVVAEGKKIKRGIYRDFPTRYRDRYGNNYQVGFKVLSVERNGQPESYHIQSMENGKRIYLGRKSVYLPPGKYTYTLTYETHRQLGFFDTHDELYWNVTGNGWEFQILQSSATVHLPRNAAEKVYLMKGYIGRQGSTDPSVAIYQDPFKDVHFTSRKALAPQEGLTIVVGWPKGFIVEPSGLQNFLYLLEDNSHAFWVGLGVLAILIYYLMAWIWVGIDPEKGTIIPLYHPPKGFSPSMVRFVSKMKYDDKAFTAAVINMAVKGYLKIEEKSSEGILNFLSGKYYVLRKVDSGRYDSLFSEEKKAAYLVDAGGEIELKKENHARIQSAMDGLKKVLSKKAERVYFMANSGFFAVGFLLSVVLAFVSFPMLSLGAQAFLMGSWIVLVIVNMIFYRLIKAPTAKGRKIMDQIEGFKMFLSVTEKDRLNFLNPPEKTPELFEKYLPYALALDVENKWADQFSDVFERMRQASDDYHPLWYGGYSWRHFHARDFSSGLSGAFSTAIASSSTPPGSSSGGGGGGFSGGGGGGGGGGGW